MRAGAAAAGIGGAGVGGVGGPAHAPSSAFVIYGAAGSVPARMPTGAHASLRHGGGRGPSRIHYRSSSVTLYNGWDIYEGIRLTL